MDEDDAERIVIDNGSYKIKAGFSGDDAPRSLFWSLTGRPRKDNIAEAMKIKSTFVGDEAQHRQDILMLRHPVQQGIVTNWDDMEKIWHHTFHKELRVAPEEYGVLLTEPPLNPRANRERMAQVMFETFNTPEFYIAIQAVLAHYASGRVTGVVYDAGDSGSHVMPVYEGHVIQHAISRSHVAGHEVTQYLCRMLQERGYSFSTPSEINIVTEIKERLGYVAQDFENELANLSDTKQSYELPDGQHICAGNERFRCVESMFKPSLVGTAGLGAHEMLYNCVMNCDIDTRKELLQSIILSGASTMFTGFADRIKKELSGMIPSSITCRVIAPPERKLSVWIGGSILSSLTCYKSMWITKQEYEEHGPSIVHRKCN